MAIETVALFITVAPKADRYGLRAPKGGCTVGGKVYKGGQFCLPFDPANPHNVVVEAQPIKVAITGFVYEVAPIPAGECGSVAFSMHKTATNNTYHILLDNHGELTCDCPDFEFRRAGTGQPCKHGRSLIELGMVNPSIPARQPAASPSPSAARRRRFVPSPEEMAEAAQMFADRR
jgi:hypothetical protein